MDLFGFYGRLFGFFGNDGFYVVNCGICLKGGMELFLYLV